jgi:hypothetical protein
MAPANDAKSKKTRARQRRVFELVRVVGLRAPEIHLRLAEEARVAEEETPFLRSPLRCSLRTVERDLEDLRKRQ